MPRISRSLVDHTSTTDAGVPIEEARQVLPGAAMMNLEFEETFGEGEQL